jgi:hypothetical protein
VTECDSRGRGCLDQWDIHRLVLCFHKFHSNLTAFLVPSIDLGRPIMGWWWLVECVTECDVRGGEGVKKIGLSADVI